MNRQNQYFEDLKAEDEKLARETNVHINSSPGPEEPENTIIDKFSDSDL